MVTAVVDTNVLVSGFVRQRQDSPPVQVVDAWRARLCTLVVCEHILAEIARTEVNRLQKTLEGANVKLASVASDVMGKSGRQMLEALVEGCSDPALLAELAKGRLREKMALLEKALAGRFGSHQRFMVAQQLAHIDFLDAAIERLDQGGAERTRLFQDDIDRLDAVPGVARRTAEALVVEIGTDMSRFPSDGHLASWAGVCPGNNESAGKRHSGKTRNGNIWLRSALVQAAHGAGRSKANYLSSQYHRLAGRRGTKKAAVAVGHSIPCIAYHLLNRKTVYQDLGPNYFDERNRARVERRHVSGLEKLK